MEVLKSDSTSVEQIKADQLREWKEPQVQSYPVADLTRSGGVLRTDGGGLGNDCS